MWVNFFWGKKNPVFLLYSSSIDWCDFIPGTERRSHSSEEEVHAGGDGASPDGAEPVQREADGASGGC